MGRAVFCQERNAAKIILLSAQYVPSSCILKWLIPALKSVLKTFIITCVQYIAHSSCNASNAVGNMNRVFGQNKKKTNGVKNIGNGWRLRWFGKTIRMNYGLECLDKGFSKHTCTKARVILFLCFSVGLSTGSLTLTETEKIYTRVLYQNLHLFLDHYFPRFFFFSPAQGYYIGTLSVDQHHNIKCQFVRQISNLIIHFTYQCIHLENIIDRSISASS